MRRTAMLGVLAGLGLMAAIAATAAFAGGGYGDYGDETTAAPATPTTESAAKETYTYTAPMTAKQEVPAPKGVPANATGGFSATVVEAGDSITLKWKLTFSGLTGKVGAAHIHKAKKGKAGPVVLALCGPCKSGQKGSAKISEAVNKAIETGNAYVNVHTTKNAAGELRGQLALVKKS